MLRDNTKIAARNTLGDGWAVWVAFLRKLYTPKDFILKKNDVVVDIGAYIGTFSVFAGQRAAKVFSYEPIPDNFKIAQKNLSINHLTNVKLMPFGVAGEATMRTFFIPVGYWDSCNLYNSSGKIPVDVRCITLSQIIEENKIQDIDFLKIDCEGAEYEILFQTSPVYLKKIKKIVMEYHSNSGYSLGKLKKFLEANSFNVTIDPTQDTLYAKRLKSI